jgi:CheY-like chemotaxis protein
LLGEEHKIRFGVVLFLVAILALQPSLAVKPGTVVSALVLMALTALVSVYGIRPQRTSASAGFEISVAVLAMLDLVTVTLLVHGTGGAQSDLYPLYGLSLIFAAAFFRGLELALLSALTCCFYGLVFVAAGGGLAAVPVLALRLSALVFIAWQAHALTVVLHREKQGNDQLLRHLAEGVVVLDDQGQVVLANQAFGSMFGVAAHELDGAGATALGERNEALQWVLQNAGAPDGGPQRTTRVGRFPEQDLPLLEVSTISCHEHGDQKGGWVVVCRDLRDVSPIAQEVEAADCDAISPLASLRALSQTLYGLTERMEEDERWRAVSLIEQHTEAMKVILARLLTTDHDPEEEGQSDRVNIRGLLSSTRRLLEIREQEQIGVTVECADDLPNVEAERGRLGRLVLRVVREQLRVAQPTDMLTLSGRHDSERVMVAVRLSPADGQASSPAAHASGEATERVLRQGMMSLSRLLAQCGAIWTMHPVAPGYVEIELALPVQRRLADLTAEGDAEAASPDPRVEGDLLSRSTLNRLNNMLELIRGRAELALAYPQQHHVAQALATAVEKADHLSELLDAIGPSPQLCARKAPALPAAEPPPAAKRPLPVLVVDDEDGVRELLVQMFQALGCDTAAAADAEQAIAYLEQQRPSLALVDLYMPGANGVAVLERAREIYPDLPVVLMSGAGACGVDEALGEQRPDAILAKPFSVNEVKELAAQMRAAS